jgi:hypothetical protein
MSFNAKMKAKTKPFHIGGQAKVSAAAAKFKKSSTEKTPLTAASVTEAPGAATG